MSTITKKRMKFYVDIEHDCDVECPSEYSVFEFISRFDVGDQATLNKCSELLDDPQHTEGQTWWPLSCYRHGGEHWFRSDNRPAYADRWDTTKMAGVVHLVATDGSDVQDDRDAAVDGFLETYNLWCSGDTWWYDIRYDSPNTKQGTCPCCHTENTTREEDHIEEYDSCGGFIGGEHVMEEVIRVFEGYRKDNPDFNDLYEIELKGDDAGKTLHDELTDSLRELGFRMSDDSNED